MRVSKRGAALVALTICLLPAGPGARAEELLVMPYACTVTGGLPVLSRGPEQSHRIIGQREQRKFTACSPVNPGMCRHWTIHRFDLDCDGTRVPWVSVVAAAGEASRRTWLVDGRLRLRMGPRWSLAQDDPCAQEPGLDDRFAYGRMRRYCADRLAMAPPPLVEIPFGYAPMLGIDGIFVKAAPSIGTAPPPLPPVVAATPPARAAGAEPLQQPAPSAPPEREPLANEGPAKSPPPASPQVAVQPPPKAAPAPASIPGGVVSPKTAGDPPQQPATVAPKAAAPEPKPTPKVAANPPAPTPATEAQKARAPDPKPAPKVAASPPPKEVAPQGPPPSKTTAEPDDKAISLNVLSVLRTTTTGAIVAFAGLALGLLTAFALARRRERVRHAGMRPRDIASVSLDGGRTKPPARLGFARGRAPPNAAASAMGRVPGAGQGVATAREAIADWGDRMPRSKIEAFQVLGVGVTPNATEVAIKKIVDGLRMSWHPDLAKDERDRVLRELRSKQINAAWELLHGQRAEA